MSGLGKLFCVPGRVTLSAAIAQAISIDLAIGKFCLFAKRKAKAPTKASPAPVESTHFTCGLDIW